VPKLWLMVFASSCAIKFGGAGAYKIISGGISIGILAGSSGVSGVH